MPEILLVSVMGDGIIRTDLSVDEVKSGFSNSFVGVSIDQCTTCGSRYGRRYSSGTLQCRKCGKILYEG